MRLDCPLNEVEVATAHEEGRFATGSKDHSGKLTSQWLGLAPHIDDLIEWNLSARYFVFTCKEHETRRREVELALVGSFRFEAPNPRDKGPEERFHSSEHCPRSHPDDASTPETHPGGLWTVPIHGNHDRPD